MPSIAKEEKRLMKLAKMIVAMSCASLLLVVMLGLTPHACAQDSSEPDGNVGAWSAPDADSAQSSPDAKAHPLDINGCWAGEVVDTGDGSGSATFEFHQNSNHKKLIIGSTFNFQWPDSAMARGPLKGTVSPTGFKFKGNAGASCAVSGSGVGNATALTGTVEFVGACAPIFQDVTFSITPGCP
jgi:hypothetical protein